MTNQKKIRTILYMVAFFIPLLVMTIVLWMEKAIPFGSASFLYADAHTQYYSMFSEMARRFYSGDFSAILWDKGVGADFYTNMLYYCISPFSLLVILFGPEKVEFSMTLIILLKMACMGIAMVAFCLHTSAFSTGDAQSKKAEDGAQGETTYNGNRELFALAASMTYVFSGYVLAYNQNLMWLDGLILLPFIALSIEVLVREKKWMGYTLLLGLAMIVNFYFAIYLCMFALFYFLLQDVEEDFLGKAFSFAKASLLAFLLSGIVMIPAALAVMGRGTYDNSYSENLIPAIGNLWNFFASYHPFHELDGMGESLYNANNYCSVAALYLALLFLADTKQKKKERMKYACFMALLILAANVKILSYVFHAFSYPHGIGNRFLFIMVFFTIIMAGKVFLAMEEPEFKKVIFLAVILLGYVLIGLLLNREVDYLFFGTAVILYSLLLVLFEKKVVSKARFIILFWGLWMVELIANALVTAPAKKNPYTYQEEVAYASYKEAYESIPVETGERKTALSDASFINSSYVDWYSSVLNGSLIDTFRAFGLSNYQFAILSYRGTTPVTALLYNVRYVLTNEVGLHGGYHALAEAPTNGNSVKEDMTFYEQDLAAGFGFMTDSKLLDFQAQGNPFENQNAFMRKSTGVEKDVFVSADLMLLDFQNVDLDILFATPDSYEYRALSEERPPIMCLKYYANRDMDLYMWNYDSVCRTVSVYLGEEERVIGKSSDNSQTIHIGKVKAGDIFDVYIISGAEKDGQGYDERYFYAFEEEIFEEMVPALLDERLEVKSIQSNRLCGEITASKPGILYLALPYSKGFSVSIDGQKSRLLKIGPGLMGVELKEGTHEIILKYDTPGLWLGCLFSVIGLGLIVGLLYSEKRKKKENQ